MNDISGPRGEERDGPAPDALRAAGDALGRWYERKRRELPWRGLADPYAILVSEVMLQQTRAARVGPFFESFMRRFPDLESLAAASAEEVLAKWSGLGYYRRARDLHAAARTASEHGGLPRTVEGLRRLPGVGPYTAAAVASIAFGVPVPAVDGNARRVLSRLLALEEDPRRAAGERRIERVASAMLDEDRPGESNQAIMELGATVCTPRAPRCAICPIEPWCAAAASGRPERFPLERAAAKRRPTELDRSAVAVRQEGRILLAERDDEAEFLAGTWEVPWTETGSQRRMARELAARYGGSWEIGERLGSVRHSITYRRFDVEVRKGRWDPPPVGTEDRPCAWFDAAARADLPTSSLVDKILEVVRISDE